MRQLFTPIALGKLNLPNRIIIAPMCQYSADHGKATEWHTLHLGHLSLSGAGLLIVEASSVAPEGRIPRFVGRGYRGGCSAPTPAFGKTGNHRSRSQGDPRHQQQRIKLQMRTQAAQQCSADQQSCTQPCSQHKISLINCAR
uniref:NADH:flavin oxidoreductase Old Yellow Enzyme family-like protein n=1 Tax=Serratia proteamaculans (strain 568) TaxID=399741 RepID=A8GCZ8_SERP5